MTLARDGLLVSLGREDLATRHGDFVVHRFHNCTSGSPALAVTFGDVGGTAALRARVHSSCVTSEAFGACDCDCAEQLDGALAHIASHGRGVLFYLTQEGRGAGFVAKALDRMLVQASPAPLTTFEAYERLRAERDERAVPAERHGCAPVSCFRSFIAVKYATSASRSAGVRFSCDGMLL